MAELAELALMAETAKMAEMPKMAEMETVMVEMAKMAEMPKMAGMPKIDEMAEMPKMAETANDVLPIVDYPPTIRGSLRVMLQLKDAFLGSFNLVEEYRDQLLACKHGFTRDLVEYQLTKGVATITRLREDLALVEKQAYGRMRRNLALRRYIVQRAGMGGGKNGIISRSTGEQDGDMQRSGTGTAVLGPSLPPPINAPDSVDNALHGGLRQFKGEINLDHLDIPAEVDLATTITESGEHLLPVVDFYRGFFFLQMHYQLLMCQAANYSMPLVTGGISMVKRTIKWNQMLKAMLEEDNGTMRDQLLEINTEVLSLAKRLHECLDLVRKKMEQDRQIEAYFIQYSSLQESTQRNLLRALQAQRMYIEQLEGQNDRLAGLAIKIDPAFAKSTDFAIMTGPGSIFQDEPPTPKKMSSNKNDADSKHSSDGNRKPDDDDDGWNSGGGGGVGTSSHPDSDYQEPTNEYAPENKEQILPIQKSSHDSQSEVEIPESDMNISASGGGRPVVWIKHGTTNKKYMEDDIEFVGKIGKLRGNTQAVDQLLIGVDAVARGTRTKGFKAHHLRHDGNAPINFDEFLSQSMENSNIKATAHLCTPSTRYSVAESLSTAVSLEQPMVTVLDSEDSLRRRFIRTETDDTDACQTDDTISAVTPVDNSFPSDRNEPRIARVRPGQLDTNVNASHVVLPHIVSRERPRPRISRKLNESRMREEAKHLYTVVSSSTLETRKPVQEHLYQGPHHQAEVAVPRQVPLVGSAECGQICIPEWLVRRSKTHTSEDLLSEPKRSAFNKAVIAHRCRLVESILQADEERLEELISVLLGE